MRAKTTRSAAGAALPAVLACLALAPADAAAHASAHAAATATEPAGAVEETTLDDLSWLVGHWRTDEEAYTEEIWTEPAGSLMLAVNRQLIPGRTAYFEYLRIETRPEGLVYLASPGGNPPTPFPLARADERRATFENPEHDWPQVIEYRLDEDATLVIHVGGLEAGSREITLRLHRVD